MSKMNMEWHEQCLKNWWGRIASEEASLSDAVARLARGKADLAFYKSQVENARRLKKDGFDQEKFMRGEKSRK